MSPLVGLVGQFVVNEEKFCVTKKDESGSLCSHVALVPSRVSVCGDPSFPPVVRG